MMHNFIKLTTLFSLILLAIILIFIVFSELLINKNADFKLEGNPKYIVLGHSHPECAYNDSLIYSFKNLSESGESYFYTYFKIKKLIEHNPSVDVLFIEFTNNQIIEIMDKWIWGEMHMKNRYPRYSPFMTTSDKFVLAVNNFHDYINSNSLSSKEILGRIMTNRYKFSDNIGAYLYLERDKTDSLINTIKTKDTLPKDSSISVLNLTYLTKIIDYATEQGKKVILIRSPLHAFYSGYSNEAIYQNIRNTKFSSVPYLDFSKFPLRNSEFGDYEHLNHKGAVIFSTWFSSLLQRGLIHNPDMQLIIEKEIEARKINQENEQLSIKSVN